METYLLFEFAQYYPAGGMDDFKSQHKTLDDAKAVESGGYSVEQQVVHATFTADGLAFTILAHRYGDAEWTTTEQAAAFTTGVPQ